MTLRVAICNERFLPRFGVDRLLVLLAQRLVDSGHEVSFHCLRCDRGMLERVSSRIYELPVPANTHMAGVERSVFGAMVQSGEGKPPDVIVIGGWPFFETGARARSLGAKSVFIDAGAVAQNGMPFSLLTMQLDLRRIRQLTLPLIDCVLPISDFIRETQSEPDRGTGEGIRTVLLGADHMELGTFSGDNRSEQTLRQVQEMKDAGKQLILLLGRFEASGYKASANAYDLLRQVRKQVPAAHLMLLDAGQDCAVPKDLTLAVSLLGMPNDLTLQEVMGRCSAGVSMSTWEGFNLPLAEMQWLSRPALSFNVGAHPEVAADPWLLCEDVTEMAGKLVLVLQGNTPLDLAPRFVAFREKRRWKHTLDRWEQEITVLAKRPSVEVETGLAQRRIVLVDVSNASLDPANPGVIRVVRRLCSELQHHSELEIVFAGWDGNDYVFLNARRRELLENFGGPKDGLGLLATCGRNVGVTGFIGTLATGRNNMPVLLIPEVVLDGSGPQRGVWAKRNGFATAMILYDLIPVLHPELCGSNVTERFPSYLSSVIDADAVWSISSATLCDFRRYADQVNRVPKGGLEAITLPGQLGEQSRQNGAGGQVADREIRILCVSTLEPRKNHLRLLKAFDDLRTRRPDLPLRLVLVGNRYLSAPEIAEQVQAASKRHPNIEWHGIVDDPRLAREFSQAAFTVYPSVVEGYGLPILESLWMGRPCLTHNGGVMQELAAEGGCITADMNDVEALSREMEKLASDPELRSRLRQEASKRRIKTWADYGSEIAERLASL